MWDRLIFLQPACLMVMCWVEFNIWLDSCMCPLVTYIGVTSMLVLTIYIYGQREQMVIVSCYVRWCTNTNERLTQHTKGITEMWSCISCYMACWEHRHDQIAIDHVAGQPFLQSSLKVYWAEYKVWLVSINKHDYCFSTSSMCLYALIFGENIVFWVTAFSSISPSVVQAHQPPTAPIVDVQSMSDAPIEDGSNLETKSWLMSLGQKRLKQ